MATSGAQREESQTRIVPQELEDTEGQWEELALVEESLLFIRALVEAVTRASVPPIVTTTHMWTTTTLESNRAVNFCFCNLSVICIMWTIIQIVTCLEFLSLDMI